ncbi:24232_t:CDS:2 [Cetraspora pellucida]|uniref:24232_t:CDS:1 n=1 Tax=Cetraspora pellucida TaxID=1433469 RepID=A0A9N9HWU6_9GLOM|nr:24232_t:CDS:2 [Cetraspora pellucida]
MFPKRKKVITPLAPKTSASKMLAPKPLASKPLVANPLPSETLPSAIHPSPLSNLANNLLLQQWQFPTTQLQISLSQLSLNISCDQENSSALDPIAINPSSATISTTSTETRMLINEVGRYQEKLKNEFFDDMDIFLRKDPSVTAPITSDSIHEIKCKMQESIEDQDADESEVKKQKGTRNKEKSNIEEIRALIKNQTDVILKIIRDQYMHAFEHPNACSITILIDDKTLLKRFSRCVSA